MFLIVLLFTTLWDSLSAIIVAPWSTALWDKVYSAKVMWHWLLYLLILCFVAQSFIAVCNGKTFLFMLCQYCCLLRYFTTVKYCNNAVCVHVQHAKWQFTRDVRKTWLRIVESIQKTWLINWKNLACLERRFVVHVCLMCKHEFKKTKLSSLYKNQRKWQYFLPVIFFCIAV